MPQPLFIQCLKLNLNEENDTTPDDPENTELYLTPEDDEIGIFFDAYKAQVEKRYNQTKEKVDFTLETSRFDPARIYETQRTIKDILDAWHAIKNIENPIYDAATRIFRNTIKKLPLPQTQPRYIWTPQGGIQKISYIRIIRINEFLYQELLETMHKNFNALEICTATDCNNFFIQNGRRNRQRFCSNRCKNRIHKRKSRDVNAK